MPRRTDFPSQIKSRLLADCLGSAACSGDIRHSVPCCLPDLVVFNMVFMKPISIDLASKPTWRLCQDCLQCAGSGAGTRRLAGIRHSVLVTKLVTLYMQTYRLYIQDEAAVLEPAWHSTVTPVNHFYLPSDGFAFGLWSMHVAL